MGTHIGKIVAAAALSLLAAANVAVAQPYPTKPIRMVVPYPPGGSADMLARNLATSMSQDLGQPVVVENRPGAGTALGTREVAAAPGDGYTLMIGTVTSHAMNPALNPKIGYDPVKDFTPIAPVATIPFALVAKNTLPVKSYGELIALSRAKPGTLTYASAGVGTSNHLAGELLQSMTGVKLNHVPYKGSAPALNDLLGGHVDMMFDLVLTATKQVQAHSVRALAVTSAKRSPQMPDVPTFAELGLPAYDVSAWFGIFAPAGVPRDVVAKLEASIHSAMKSPEMKKQLAASGVDPMEGSAADFATLVGADYRKWADVIRDRGLQSTQ
ncbi:MAG: tripartite tricarboxylate transporter substrate binding protein [Burkholderiaceae bacterium]|nr:tripartite tricarboxylate transporter substrate binding protein [Burkholderiaceae bacterium]